MDVSLSRIERYGFYPSGTSALHQRRGQWGHFLQTMEAIQDKRIPHSTYFKPLKSSRYVNMLEALEKQSYWLHGETFASQGVDYFKSFSELNELP
jgi:hypothetical protein